jgi:hypothetical protein
MYKLYLKTHNITGLKYLGYTKNDPFKYPGSGHYWKKHLKEHGNDVKTEILFEHDNIEVISEIGMGYSVEWNIVESNEFANLCNEDGNLNRGMGNINFRGHPHSEQTRKKISENNGRGLKGKFGEKHPCFGRPRLDNSERLKKAWAEGKLKSIGGWNKGLKMKPHTDEHKQKMSKAMKGIKKKKVKCPHCSIEGGAPALKRWHFDNCKHKEGSL